MFNIALSIAYKVDVKGIVVYTSRILRKFLQSANKRRWGPGKGSLAGDWIEVGSFKIHFESKIQLYMGLWLV